MFLYVSLCNYSFVRLKGQTQFSENVLTVFDPLQRLSAEYLASSDSQSLLNVYFWPVNQVLLYCACFDNGHADRS